LAFQNENSALKKEIGTLTGKLAAEAERHTEAAKAWQQTEAKMKEQLSQLADKEAAARKNLEEVMNSAEGLKEQLKIIQVFTASHNVCSCFSGFVCTDLYHGR
jgi:predicted nuclease with TOPRIM domain